MPNSKAILGFRPHTGWTVAVSVGGSLANPKIIDRCRIEFGPPGEERFVYHRAAEGPHTKAAASIAKIRSATAVQATRAIESLLRELKNKGIAVHAAAVPTSRKPLPEKLDDILSAHSRIHAAEGAFYRDIVAAACADAGLKVHRVIERELPALASALLPDGKRGLDPRLREMGAALGPPWSEDQKLATLAAWIHLAEK
ncbi:MAG: hypothetical protein ABSA49_19540 [Rhizomicrobium sp.]|jgi:hypothetical protein